MPILRSVLLSWAYNLPTIITVCLWYTGSQLMRSEPTANLFGIGACTLGLLAVAFLGALQSRSVIRKAREQDREHARGLTIIRFIGAGVVALAVLVIALLVEFVLRDTPARGLASVVFRAGWHALAVFVVLAGPLPSRTSDPGRA